MATDATAPLRRITYDKLVRDKIPALLTEWGKKPEWDTLDGPAFIAALKAKVVEEAQEVAAAQTKAGLAEEIGDLWDVIETLMIWADVPWYAVAEARSKKLAEKGHFTERVRLISALEPVWKPGERHDDGAPEVNHCPECYVTGLRIDNEQPCQACVTPDKAGKDA